MCNEHFYHRKAGMIFSFDELFSQLEISRLDILLFGLIPVLEEYSCFTQFFEELVSSERQFQQFGRLSDIDLSPRVYDLVYETGFGEKSGVFR